MFMFLVAVVLAGWVIDTFFPLSIGVLLISMLGMLWYSLTSVCAFIPLMIRIFPVHLWMRFSSSFVYRVSVKYFLYYCLGSCLF